MGARQAQYGNFLMITVIIQVSIFSNFLNGPGNKVQGPKSGIKLSELRPSQLQTQQSRKHILYYVLLKKSKQALV